jgi:hypothetical protein
MTLVEKYKKEHYIDETLDCLFDYDSYSEYQKLVRELDDYICFLEELLREK